MRGLRRWIGVGAALGVIVALVPVVRGSIAIDAPLRKLSSAVGVTPKSKEPPKLDGLDLLRLDLRPQRVMAPLKDGQTAELTLDPAVQRVARAQMQKYRMPESGVVVMDVKTGKLLAYASYVNEGEAFDVNARAEAPAASVFKVITGSALVEKGGLNSESEQCYHGGKSRILPDELVDDPRRDKWCATVAIAMGRSLNVVFGRLAQKHLTPEDVAQMGGAFGFGASVPFAVAERSSQDRDPAGAAGVCACVGRLLAHDDVTAARRLDRADGGQRRRHARAAHRGRRCRAAASSCGRKSASRACCAAPSSPRRPRRSRA